MSQIKEAAEADRYLHEHIPNRRINHKEFFWILLLTRSNYILGLKEISSGKSHSTTVSFKEIAQTALLANCSSLILMHNHPTGNLVPSEDDKSITTLAAKTLKIIDITLLDHLIITQEGFSSFAEHNLI